MWVLCAPSADDVLVTIRSRCRHIGLRVPPYISRSFTECVRLADDRRALAA